MFLRNKLLVVTLALMLLMASVGIVSAQGPSGSYASGIACANLSATAPANIVVNFYASDSASVVLSYPDPTAIPVGGSRNYFTPSTPPGLPSGFAGSAVVSSDQPLLCTVNTQVVSTGVGSASTPARVDTSIGVNSDKAANKLYAPEVMKALSGSYNSYIAVQNVESTAQSVTITYVDRFGVAAPASATQTANIPPQSNHIFYQGNNAGLPNGFLGGATIQGSGKLAAVVAFYNSGSSATTAQFNTYTAFPAGASKLFVPRFVRNYYGYNGGLSVQNLGATATTVKVTFTFNGVDYIVNSPSIAPGGTYSPYAKDIVELAPIDALGVGLRTGSAVIETTGTVVAIVNEDNRGTCYTASCPAIPPEQNGLSNTYNAFLDGAQTNTTFFSQVTRKAATIYSGGFQVANTTNTAATCTINYSGASAATETNVPLAANSSFSRFAPNVTNLPDGFNSSVKVTCTQPVIGISNLSARSATYLGDTFAAANGLNQ